ncbi:TCP-1/cpn60 chaperonin family protein [Candidatus Palauibacter sp.]|uniref:TCP-1/cpn60 chaperonin family protein n=1 Tax=Candidatus Palauibacter sp. TaxID=3101350 RepID=UPI003B023F92
MFVIMPFIESPTRRKEQLTSFFENNIKRPIEAADLRCDYSVYRSGDAFNITDKIIKDLYDADIVIADLSGHLPNPNVMYELGVRLAISNKPMILIREDHSKNRDIFDISPFYIFSYDPLDYAALETHLIGKLGRFESGEESYRSPVREVLRLRLAAERAAEADLAPDEQRRMALNGILRVGDAVRSALGPRGKAIRRRHTSGEVARAQRGIEIARTAESSQSAEQAGIELCRELAEDVEVAVGDGTKICLRLFAVSVEEGDKLVRAGSSWPTVVEAIEKSAEVARRSLTAAAWQASRDDVVAVACTASGSKRIGSEVVRLMHDVGSRGLIELEHGQVRSDQATVTDGILLRTGYANDRLLSDTDSGAWARRSARVLLYCHRITDGGELIPILEKMAEKQTPLLIVADEVSGEAMATVEVNNRQGRTDVMVIRIPSLRGHSSAIFEDLAVYTGGSVISEERGSTLRYVTESDLGKAEHITVDRTSTLVGGGTGDRATVQAYAARLRATSEDMPEHDAERVTQRVAMLIGRIASVAVGGVTADDHRRRYTAWLSALRAARAAEGAPVMLGSGKPLAQAMARVTGDERDTPVREEGDAFLSASRAPLEALAENAGLDVRKTLEDVLGLEDDGMSLDAGTGKIADLRSEGVLDSVAVWDRAIEVAVSGVRTFFETDQWVS